MRRLAGETDNNSPPISVKLNHGERSCTFILLLSIINSPIPQFLLHSFLLLYSSFIHSLVCYWVRITYKLDASCPHVHTYIAPDTSSNHHPCLFITPQSNTFNSSNSTHCIIVPLYHCIYKTIYKINIYRSSTAKYQEGLGMAFPRGLPSGWQYGGSASPSRYTFTGGVRKSRKGYAGCLELWLLSLFVL